MKNPSNLRIFILAGLCGGLAEVIWIGAFSLISSIPLATVGRGIAATVVPATAGLALAPVLGLGIHMALSLVLALGFGTLIWPLVQRLHSTAGMLIICVLTLALVWKINFYLLLPLWNAEFVALLPLPVTLASKLLFGLAMGMVLVRAPRRRHAITGV